jgi:dihydrofolate reductase
MKTIVAVDRNWGIGKDNDLLFHLPTDMKFFRQTTLGKVIVMGSNTLRSFPGGNPLKNRTNIVLYPGGSRDDCTVAQSLAELSEILSAYSSEDVYIVGGAMFYRTMLPYCSEALVTKVDADGQPQVYFENLDRLENWTLERVSQPVTENDLTFRFCTYRNLSPKEF